MNTVKIITKKDVILILILILSASLILLFTPKHSANTADILVSGEVVKTLTLQKNSVFEYCTSGHTYEIEVTNGAIGIKNADCPDKICVNTGYISSSETVIACLPGKLVIKINSASGPDAVTY